MQTGPKIELGRQLREAGPEELHRLVPKHLEELDPPIVRLLLRNPHLDLQIMEMVLSQKQLLVNHQVRRDLASHPVTPEVRALRLVSTLFWKDLLEISCDHRARPRVRRAAERHLLERLPGLAGGEKTAIARRSGPLIVAQIRRDPDPRVISALLENPRLTEGGLMPLVASETTLPEILKVVAKNQKWGNRYGVRLALCRNRRTPLDISLGLLPMLKKQDLAGIERDFRLHMAVRRRAAVLLGRKPI